MTRQQPPTDPTNNSRYAQHLAEANRAALGWLPRDVYPHAAAAGRLYTAHQNGEPAGFLLRGPLKRHAKIYQACVQLDARRIAHATAMVRRLINDANEAGAHTLALWCAADLAANAFWLAMGFKPIAHRVKSKHTKRPQVGYELLLPAGAKRQDQLANDPKHQRTMQLLRLFAATAPNRAAAAAELRKRER